MNDFLHNLKNNSKWSEKRLKPHPQKFTSHSEKENGEVNGNIKRNRKFSNPPNPASSSDISLLLSELVILLTIYIEEHTKHQKQMIEIFKRRTEAKEKSAEALGEIAFILSKAGGSEPILSPVAALVNHQNKESDFDKC